MMNSVIAAGADWGRTVPCGSFPLSQHRYGPNKLSPVITTRLPTQFAKCLIPELEYEVLCTEDLVSIDQREKRIGSSCVPKNATKDVGKD